MFRIIPHRAFIEPEAVVTGVVTTAEGAAASLRIDGLLCSACAINVRRRLESVDGVRSAHVDLARSAGLVTYDPGRATPQALVEAIERAVVLRPARRLLAALAGHRGRREERNGLP